MVDSTCVMQSFLPSSKQQGDLMQGLGGSVSFGKFKTQTLEWDKFSAFNQNRYLEEAQQLAKPGLVAQRKALFEAHFKKPVADKVPGVLKVPDKVSGVLKAADKFTVLVKAANFDAKNEVRVPMNDVTNENICVEPCNEMGTVKARCGFFNKVAMTSTDAWPRLGLDHPLAAPLIESQSSSPVILEQTDGPGYEMSADTSEGVEVSPHKGSSCHSSNINPMVVEPKSFENIDSFNGLKTELNLPEVVGILTIPMTVSQDKIAVQEPIDNFALDSTADSKPDVAFSNTSTSVKKPAVQSRWKLRSQAFSMKENIAPENSNASGIGMANRKRVITKPLHVPINRDSGLPASKKPLAARKLSNMIHPTNSVCARGSKVSSAPANQSEYSSHVTTIESQVKTTTSSEAPPQLKRKMTIIRTDRASLRKSLVQKATSKLETPALLQSTGTKSVSNTVAMSKSFSTHGPANKVLSDSTNMGKQTAPLSNTSMFGRKSTIQFHAKSLSKTGSGVIQINSALTLSHNNLKKSLPIVLHTSAGTSSNVDRVKKSSMGKKCGSSRIKALDVNMSKKSSNHQMQESFKKSMDASATLRSDDKGRQRPVTGLNEPSNGTMMPKRRLRPSLNVIRPPTTVFTPFRFRSDERAAKRKQQLEGKGNTDAENPSQSKRKGPSSNKLQASLKPSNNKT